jgi:hypothetical protein
LASAQVIHFSFLSSKNQKLLKQNGTRITGPAGMRDFLRTEKGKEVRNLLVERQGFVYFANSGIPIERSLVKEE